MRIALLAPVHTSMYARLLAWRLGRTDGIELTDVLLRAPYQLDRLRDELRLTTPGRVLAKVTGKVLVGSLSSPREGERSVRDIAAEEGLPGASLRDVAAAIGARFHVVQNHNDDRSLAALRAAAPDLIVFAGGGLLRAPLLAIPRIGVLNAHAGVLPRYRGMDVALWPFLEDGPPELGVTVHLIDTGVDTGPVLLVERFALEPGDDHPAVMRRVERVGLELMCRAVRGLRDGTLTPSPQAADAGRQHFVLHPAIAAIAARRLRALAR
ncbi:formyl transferase [Sorangium sp. So ce426]|uniref:formyl transferase n=1 Tax=unclassified Sorangium TaxID=2621164 RepID=UPI003F5B917D